MAVKYQYLVDPLLGFQTKSGSLNTAGIIRVFDAATDDPVVTYKDFAGTANAQDIRLDDNGRAVIIADDSRAYRVEVCDRYGALLYTQTPLYAKGGGGGVMTGVNVISSDETVKVETTTEGGIKTFDLSVDKDDPEYIVCDSYFVKGYGNAGCGYIVPDHKVEGNMSLTSDGILLKAGGHYHVDAWIDAVADGENGDPSNSYRLREMLLNLRLGSDDGTPVNLTFDNSFAHTDSYNLSGDIHPVTDTYLKVYYDNYEWADYQSGYILSSHLQMPHINVHSIVGSYNGGGGGGTTYSAGEGIDITNNTISVDQSVIQHKLVAGDNITINPVTNVISVTGLTQEQADWSQLDSTAPDYIKNKPDLSQYVTSSELATDLSDYQKKLVAGTNISIDPVTNVISASGAAAQIQSDWTQSDSSSVDYIKHKPTEKTLVAGSNITITESGSNVTISSTSAPQVQSDWSQSNSGAVDYIKNKPQNLVQDASYVHTDNNFTNADKNKLDGIESGAEANVQANWNETNSSSDAYIQNKPQNLVQDASYVHTDNNFTNADKSKLDGIESGAEANVQANWNETNSSSDAYIQNKPDLSQYATTTDLSDKADKVDGATSGNLAGLDSNGNLTDSGIAASDVATQSDLSGKQDTLTPGSNVTITNNVISATDTNTHRPIQLGGSQILGDNTDPLNFVAGSNVTITNNNGSLTIAASGGTFTQVQSDWTQTNSSSVDFIKNKPTEKSLVAGSNITLVEGNNNVTVSATVPVVGTVVV